MVIQINNYIYKRKLKKINKQSLFFNHKKSIEVNGLRKSYYKFILMELNTVQRKYHLINFRRSVKQAYQIDKIKEKFRKFKKKQNQKYFNYNQINY